MIQDISFTYSTNFQKIQKKIKKSYKPKDIGQLLANNKPSDYIVYRVLKKRPQITHNLPQKQRTIEEVLYC